MYLSKDWLMYTNNNNIERRGRNKSKDEKKTSLSSKDDKKKCEKKTSSWLALANRAQKKTVLQQPKLLRDQKI